MPSKIILIFNQKYIEYRKKYGLSKLSFSAVLNAVFFFTKVHKEQIPKLYALFKQYNLQETNEIKHFESGNVFLSKRQTFLGSLKNKNVVVRFAPSPSGPLHIGHSRIIYLNSFLKQYSKSFKFILRIEDTNPAQMQKINYIHIYEDFRKLGIEYDELFFQSERINIYVKYVIKLIKKGLVFFCFCSEKMRKKLEKSNKLCKHSKNKESETLQQMKEIFTLKKKGVLLLKLDLKNSNPAMRILPIFRIIKLKNNIFFSPLMNFSVAIDDILMKITHVIRGVDHESNTTKQKLICKLLGFKNKITYVSVGFLKSSEENPISTSGILQKIQKKEYLNWEDPKANTLKSFFNNNGSIEKLFIFWKKYLFSEKTIFFDEEVRQTLLKN